MVIEDKSLLRLLRLGLEGAMVGLSVAGIVSAILGFDRTIPDWIGGGLGFVAALAVLRRA